MASDDNTVDIIKDDVSFSLVPAQIKRPIPNDDPKVMPPKITVSQIAAQYLLPIPK